MGATIDAPTAAAAASFSAALADQWFYGCSYHYSHRISLDLTIYLVYNDHYIH